MNYHFIHVGKCAGESIARALHPVLPNLTEYHCGNAPDDIAKVVLRKRQDNTFIIAMRDPVDRFVSAFEWDLFSKSKDGDTRTFSNETWRAIYETFPTANDLAEALSGKDESRRKLANVALKASQLHLHFDLAWYLPPVIAAQLPKGRTHLIWTKTIQSDTNQFLRSQELAPTSVGQTKNDYKWKLPESRVTQVLTPLARRNVIDSSQDSYRTIHYLKKIALSQPAGTVG